MDINDWMQQMADHQRQIFDILEDCQNGPDELKLLASKMMPIMENYQSLQEDILAQMKNENESPREPE